MTLDEARAAALSAAANRRATEDRHREEMAAAFSAQREAEAALEVLEEEDWQRRAKEALPCPAGALESGGRGHRLLRVLIGHTEAGSLRVREMEQRRGSLDDVQTTTREHLLRARDAYTRNLAAAFAAAKVAAEGG